MPECRQREDHQAAPAAADECCTELPLHLGRADTYDWFVSVGGPSITDWLAAIGTVGTLGATVALFWIDRYQRRMREDRSQAALISA
jgi:hypothetical protein